MFTSRAIYMPLAWLIACLFGIPTTSHAEAVQSLDSIRLAAERHLISQLPKGRRYLVNASALDNRLRLPACLTPLEAFLPSGANVGVRVSVAVRCTDGNGWTIYVPTNIDTQVSSLVLTRSIARGSAITAQDVELREQRVAGSGTAVMSDVQQLVGQHAKRDLSAGTVLTPSMLAADLMVKRGQQVTLLAVSGPIEVRSQGIALSDGALNDRIRVRNLNSTKVVEGLVDSQSQVKVSL